MADINGSQQLANKTERSYDLRDLPPSHIRDMVNSVVFEMDYDVVAEPARCLTQFQGARLGPIDVYRYEGFGLRRSSRLAHHISSDHVDDFVICLPVQGAINILQDGLQTNVVQGQFAVMATAKPYSAWIAATQEFEPFDCIQARVSGHELRSRVPVVDNNCDQTIQIRKGAGRIMQSFFEVSVREGGNLADGQGWQMGAALTDMIANSLLEAPELRRHRFPSAQTSSMRLVQTAKAFVESRLADPDLNVACVARHCHVSLRSLQSAFAATAQTLVSYVRQRRLDCCHRMLRDPGKRHQSVTQIAMNWGFNEPAHFSRIYRAQFGVSPSEDRRGT